MKRPILLMISSITLLLSACQSSQPVLGANGAEQLNNIRHLCILSNPKNPNPGLNRQIAQSLTKYGISSETVDAASNRKRLYEPECRYNLRYNTRGIGNNMHYLSLLIRTPEHPVASLRANPNFRNPQNQQAEIDRIIGTLLNKK
ncbi:hypothetical protein LVJ83_09300 [Uruburuella testudinis]|uniref:Lipoprotein n=1 Tax=Uruburuella testudinis TaxID=1282863 RepID=A0ABY4DQ28_9NEIS|nr:hypothetical protein [Uruburuella testudinis]UOO81168.1 hypothetical protein LVJ83_09300 [Uruburuella testudinis]